MSRDNVNHFRQLAEATLKRSADLKRMGLPFPDVARSLARHLLMAAGVIGDQAEQIDKQAAVCRATGFDHPAEAREWVTTARQVIDQLAKMVWPCRDYEFDPVPMAELVEQLSRLSANFEFIKRERDLLRQQAAEANQLLSTLPASPHQRIRISEHRERWRKQRQALEGEV